MTSSSTSDRSRGATDLWIALAGLLAILAWEWSGWDLAASAAFVRDGGFPWRDHWLTSRVLHDGGRWAGWLLFSVLLLDAIRPTLAGPTRTERWRGIAIMLIALVAVPALKRFSATSCPWDLQPFGGPFPFVPHWRLGIFDGGPGRCFPSGHAVAAFAFFGAYFAWRRTRPRLAAAGLAAVLVVGTAYGWAQLARGAHFVSHTLWSAWLCWAIGAALEWASVRTGLMAHPHVAFAPSSPRPVPRRARRLRRRDDA